MFIGRSKVRTDEKNAVAVEELRAQYSITDGYYSALAQEINQLFCFLAIEGQYCCIIFCMMSPERKKKFEWI